LRGEWRGGRSPFVPFLNSRGASHMSATFTRLSRHARAARVCEAEKRVDECVCDRIVAVFANFGGDLESKRNTENMNTKRKEHKLRG